MGWIFGYAGRILPSSLKNHKHSNIPLLGKTEIILHTRSDLTQLKTTSLKSQKRVQEMLKCRDFFVILSDFPFVLAADSTIK